MRNGIRKKLRADLRQVRQDVLIQLQEREARTIPEAEPEEKTSPALLETIARQMLEELGGGHLVIMKRGAQTIQERAAELVEEEQCRLKRRW